MSLDGASCSNPPADPLSLDYIKLPVALVQNLVLLTPKNETKESVSWNSNGQVVGVLTYHTHINLGFHYT